MKMTFFMFGKFHVTIFDTTNIILAEHMHRFSSNLHSFYIDYNNLTKNLKISCGSKILLPSSTSTLEIIAINLQTEDPL